MQSYSLIKSKILIVIILVFLTNLIVLSVNGQFTNPVTHDNYNQCPTENVQNTGSSTYKDFQVIVNDGNEPSITFIEYTIITGGPIPVPINQSWCFPLLGYTNGLRISDPDVVWDYNGSMKAHVVYQVDNGNGYSIWSELWDFGSGNPFPDLNYGNDGLFMLSQNGVYPNIDAATYPSGHIDKGISVVVWENNSKIETIRYGFNSNTFGLIGLVNDPNCGLKDAIQPDVALYTLDGKTYVSYVFVQDFKGVGEIVVVGKFGIHQNPWCFDYIHKVEHAGGIIPTKVQYPRIDAHTYYDSRPHFYHNQARYDCSVVYELIEGSRTFVGSSVRYTYDSGLELNPISPPDYYVIDHSYNPPAWPTTEWISDVLNANVGITTSPAPAPFNNQLSPPNLSIEDSPNKKPVVAMIGNMINNTAWNWSDNNSVRYQTDEILLRRIFPIADNNISQPPYNTSFQNLTGSFGFKYSVPASFDFDYFVVGEGWMYGFDQSVVSISGNLYWVDLAFYESTTSRIGYKRGYLGVNNPLRTSGSSEMKGEKLTSNKSPESLQIIYNKESYVLEIINEQGIAHFQVIDGIGRSNKSKKGDGSKHIREIVKIDSDFFIVTVVDLNGTASSKKFLIK